MALPSVDDKVAAVAATLTDLVRTYGSAQCVGVPVEQMQRLRSAVRRLHRAAGMRVTTSAWKGMLIIEDPDRRNEMHPEIEEVTRVLMPFAGDGTARSRADVRWAVYPHHRSWSDF
jgi:hypothetical protein